MIYITYKDANGNNVEVKLDYPDNFKGIFTDRGKIVDRSDREKGEVLMVQSNDYMIKYFDDEAGDYKIIKREDIVSIENDLDRAEAQQGEENTEE